MQADRGAALFRLDRLHLRDQRIGKGFRCRFGLRLGTWRGGFQIACLVGEDQRVAFHGLRLNHLGGPEGRGDINGRFALCGCAILPRVQEGRMLCPESGLSQRRDGRIRVDCRFWRGGSLNSGRGLGCCTRWGRHLVTNLRFRDRLHPRPHLRLRNALNICRSSDWLLCRYCCRGGSNGLRHNRGLRCGCRDFDIGFRLDRG